VAVVVSRKAAVVSKVIGIVNMIEVADKEAAVKSWVGSGYQAGKGTGLVGDRTEAGPLVKELAWIVVEKAGAGSTVLGRGRKGERRRVHDSN